MQVVLTALSSACQSSVLRHKDAAFAGRRARKSLSALCKRPALLKLAGSAGIGMCVISGMGTAPALAVAPAKYATAPFQIAAQPGPQASRTDPLRSIVPVEPATTLTYGQLQELFITSMPLTNPPAAEGDTEDDIDATPVEYVDFEEMRVPRWIVDTILRASEITDADPVYMMALADKESSFLPGNKASTSSAVGLFQFITSTWLEAVRSFGPKHGLTMEASFIENQGGKLSVPDDVKREHILGLRRNPYISALMAAEMMQRDKAKIEAKLGRKLSRSEFYLSHFFGVDSASKFIALVDDTPKKSAKSAFPKAAKSNKSLFYATEGKKTRQLSVSEVYGKIDTMIDKRLTRYEDVSSRVTAEAEF